MPPDRGGVVRIRDSHVHAHPGYRLRACSRAGCGPQRFAGADHAPALLHRAVCRPLHLGGRRHRHAVRADPADRKPAVCRPTAHHVHRARAAAGQPGPGGAGAHRPRAAPVCRAPRARARRHHARDVHAARHGRFGKPRAVRRPRHAGNQGRHDGLRHQRHAAVSHHAGLPAPQPDAGGAGPQLQRTGRVLDVAGHAGRAGAVVGRTPPQGKRKSGYGPSRSPSPQPPVARAPLAYLAGLVVGAGAVVPVRHGPDVVELGGRPRGPTARAIGLDHAGNFTEASWCCGGRCRGGWPGDGRR
ncbi:hypothetical protein D3C72_1414190 [compost metagenome]